MTGDQVLEGYSASPGAAAVWRALLANPSATLEELSDAGSLSSGETRAALDALCRAQLIRCQDEARCGYVANDPAPALEVLALQTERRIATEAENLARFRTQIPALSDLFAEGRARVGLLPGFEIITSLDEIRRQIYLESERSTDQLRTLVHNASHGAYIHARETDLRTLARGVRLRSIVRSSDLQRPGVYESSLWLHEHGEEVRASPEVPTQIQILDGKLAVVRVDPNDPAKGAMFIRVRNLVDLLIDLYERMWDEAEELFPAPQAASSLTDRQHRLLALLAAGAKDEAIARAFSVGVRTIRRDISELKTTTGATSRTDLVAVAIRKGWIAGSAATPESSSRVKALPERAS